MKLASKTWIDILTYFPQINYHHYFSCSKLYIKLSVKRKDLWCWRQKLFKGSSLSTKDRRAKQWCILRLYVALASNVVSTEHWKLAWAACTLQAQCNFLSYFLTHQLKILPKKKGEKLLHWWSKNEWKGKMFFHLF